MAALVPGEKARMYALMGVARMGATRMGYVSGKVFIKYGGVGLGWDRTGALGVLIGSLSINQELDETPDTCRFTVNGGVPSIGDEVIVTLGSVNNQPMFAGFGLTTNQKYVGDKPANVQCDVAAVDYTWQLGFHLVTAQYRNMRAGAIVQDLVARYAAADGFTAKAVDPDLVYLDEITFTNEDLPAAITRTMRRAGAYWYCDYRRDVHAFISETLNGAPEPLTPAHTSLAHVTRQLERTQVLTRVYVEGRGSRLLGAVGAGDTKVPLDAVDMFAVAPDVFAKASFQGAEGGAQHLNFSGVVTGGGGSVVGTGMGPTTAPIATGRAGGSVDSGTHSYAYTFVTATGESLASPLGTVTLGPVGNPTIAPLLQNLPDGGPWTGSVLPIGIDMCGAYAWSTAENQADAFTAVTAAIWSPTNIRTVSNNDPLNPTHAAKVEIKVKHCPDPRVKWICIYQWSTTYPTWAAYTSIANNPSYGPDVWWAEWFLSLFSGGTGLPPANVTALNLVDLSSIGTGAAAVTARKIYRTAANQSALKLLTTIANNTATTYTDAAADSTLGAAPPASDTSGLKQPEGQVLPGATSLPIAGNAPFESAGGWAVIGNGEQVIRYTSASGGSLTGIPASGIGSITATVVYNSTVTAAPMLIGIPPSGPRSIVRPLTAGDEMYLVVQVDDATNQSGLAADVGGTGIREEWVQDRRLSIPEARARGRATIALRPLDAETLNYTSRDLRTAVGKMVTASLPAPTNISGTYRIQSVQIDNFRPRGTQYPTFTVRASSTMFSFDDWLRRMRTEV